MIQNGKYINNYSHIEGKILYAQNNILYKIITLIYKAAARDREEKLIKNYNNNNQK